MLLTRVISGGQTGADQAGWRAAKSAGIPTGGWMPKGFLTEDGPRPEFQGLYGAEQTPSRDYPMRTRRNAQDSAVTIWFGRPFSPGGKLTLKCAREVASFTYIVERPDGEWRPEHIARHVGNAFEQQDKASDLPEKRRRVLNVAGNRESSAPGIGEWVERYLAEVFRLVKEG